MTDEQQAGPGLAALGEQQANERFAGVRVQRRRRLIGNHQLRLTDQRPGCSDPLLLADGQRVGAACQHRRVFQTQVGEQGSGRFLDAAVALPGTLGTHAGKMAGQFDVFPHRQKRQQVELLKDVAGMVDAKAIARGRREG